jgi:hypothetical protein
MNESPYSVTERVLHNFAYSIKPFQIALADFEDKIWKRDIRNQSLAPPVFITSLPRAGTTLLLNNLAQLEEMASHTYRDMPFVLTPILWHRLSRRFRQKAVSQERAHADGMQVDFDSPEAFEEIIWQTFWKKKFTQTSIKSIDKSENNTYFQEFFVQHMKKIVWLRGTRSQYNSYLSKNNANINRIPYLRKLFPQSSILVPFRNPVDHAQSLLRQHLRFRDMHLNNPFSRKYMAHLGHFEFGQLHKPLKFSEMEKLSYYNSETLEYWLTYWLLAFKDVLAHFKTSEIALIAFDTLRSEPERGLERIASYLGLSEPERLLWMASFYTPAKDQEKNVECDPFCLQAAQELYKDLLAASIV